MKKRLNTSTGISRSIKGRRGFTMLELVVAMATASILMIGCISSYVFLVDTQGKNKKMTKQHRKLRGSLSLSALDFQAAGRAGLQPRNAGLFGVTDIRRRALDGTLDPNGFPAVVFDSLMEDRDSNGRLDDDDLPTYTITWRLTDFDGDGGVVPDLVQITDDNNGNLANGGNPVELLITRDVQNIGFAFATDNDRDGVLDQQGGGTRWAANSADPAGQLDIQLDANSDGTVDELDDTNLDGVIDAADGAAVTLGTTIPLVRIRQVRMYVLVQSPDRDIDYINQNAYVFGQNVLHPFALTDLQKRYQFHRQVLSIGVSVRNREPDLAL
jgi:prepilin-type N-terminal cleavage/methylation domain-containing protein